MLSDGSPPVLPRPGLRPAGNDVGFRSAPRKGGLSETTVRRVAGMNALFVPAEVAAPPPPQPLSGPTGSRGCALETAGWHHDARRERAEERQQDAAQPEALHGALAPTAGQRRPEGAGDGALLHCSIVTSLSPTAAGAAEASAALSFAPAPSDGVEGPAPAMDARPDGAGQQNTETPGGSPGGASVGEHTPAQAGAGPTNAGSVAEAPPSLAESGTAGRGAGAPPEQGAQPAAGVGMASAAEHLRRAA